MNRADDGTGELEHMYEKWVGGAAPPLPEPQYRD
jgi:hypothetical protein